MKRLMLGLIAGLIALTAAEEAMARSVVVRTVNIRSGPDSDYPAVARLKKNSTIEVYGCIEDWDWCDIRAGRYRGWIRGDSIYTTYRNRNVAFVEAAPALHIPIIGFNINYWDEHYRKNSFYRDRSRWEHRRYDHGWHDRDDRHDHDHDDDRRDNDHGWNDRRR